MKPENTLETFIDASGRNESQVQAATAQKFAPRQLPLISMYDRSMTRCQTSMVLTYHIFYIPSGNLA